MGTKVFLDPFLPFCLMSLVVTHNVLTNNLGVFRSAVIVKDIGRGGLIGYVKSIPFGPGQIISIDVLVIVMIIPVFYKHCQRHNGPRV